MQAGKVLCKKLRSAFLFVVALVRRIFCFWRRRRKSEDSFPLSVVVDRNATAPKYPQWSGSGEADQWDNWNKKPFPNDVEEKIEEFRRKKVEALEQTEAALEPDYFNDMQPQVKRTRKAYVGGSKKEEEQQSLRGNLFAFSANDFSPVIPSGELGLLQEHSENEVDTWDDSLDIEGVNEVLKEQRVKERREKQLQRRMERERRLKEKKGVVQS